MPTLLRPLRKSHVSLCPCARAATSAETPLRLLISSLHPANAKHLTISVWPCCAAKCNGYWPSLLVTSTIQPKAHSDWAKFSNPSFAAKWMAVFPEISFGKSKSAASMKKNHSHVGIMRAMAKWRGVLPSLMLTKSRFTFDSTRALTQSIWPLLDAIWRGVSPS